MRTLDRNKQKMYYALYAGEVPIYDYYIDQDGNKIPIDTGETQIGYSKPVEFQGNIAMSGSESENTEFGIDKSQYSAVLVVDKEELPIDETSLIWYETLPVVGISGEADANSADYTVVKVDPSLNSARYLLKKVVK